MASGKKTDRPVKLNTAGKSIFVLTLMYFIIELIVNVSIFSQLSSSSDFLMVKVMEFWGKIIAGLGMALIITRYHMERLKRLNLGHIAKIYKTFLFSSLITIPLSFAFQEGLIHYLVSKASDADKNKAILVAATHGTVVPFYAAQGKKDWHNLSPLQMTAYPASRWFTSRGDSFRWSKEKEVESRSPCITVSQSTLGVASDTDKVFFQYKAMLTGVNEALYKEVIKAHYLCAFEDKRYFTNRTAGIISHTSMLWEAYHKVYDPAVEKYLHYTGRSLGRQKTKDADKRWREEMDSIYGFKTTIRPMSSYPKHEGDPMGESYFYEHKDTRRFYAEQTGITDLYPFDDNFVDQAKAKIRDNLPGFMIPAYTSPTGERSEYPKRLTDAQVAEHGDKAYKAIIMPIIALGLSGFFLILNIILMLNTAITRRIVKQNNPTVDYIVRHAFLVVALAWFLLWPSLQKGEAYEAFEHAKFEQASKWLYYHESNLIPIYNVGHKAIIKFSHAIENLVEET